MAKKKRAGKQATPTAPPPAEAPIPPMDPAGTQETGAGGDPRAPGEKEPRPAWRSGMDFLVMIAGAVLAALLIKAYAFDVYLIPSGSMETALHGRPDGGDRIFCSKLNYRFRSPKRWEVAVFEFPYETARRTDTFGVTEQYRGQNFVKRIVGLPGETLAIGRGDIWVRGDGNRAQYRRLVKPDSVQRSMWLNVYEQDFQDITLGEFARFWKLEGGDATLERGGPLRLRAGSGPAAMHYRPLVPAGADKSQMVELPGIPDRYTLEQPVQFRCDLAGKGEGCGHVFVQTFKTHNMQARCPRCGLMNDETSAIFYHRRSGLTALGKYAVDPRAVPQGEDTSPRQTEYHIVPDLRVVTEASLDADGVLAIDVREDSRFVRAVIRGDGGVELEIDGEASLIQNRAVAAIRPGVRHRVEFSIADGTARLFLDSEDVLLEREIWNDRRPMPRALPKSSGVSVLALSGEARLSSLKIDRDVFYYSGWEHDRGEKFAMMNSHGEVIIDGNSFFPMGDHCTSSYDARSWGPVPTSLLRGPALFIWWPPERAGRIPSPQ